MTFKKSPLIVGAGVLACFGLGMGGAMAGPTRTPAPVAAELPGAAFIPQSIIEATNAGFAGVGEQQSRLTFEQVEAMRKAAADRLRVEDINSTLTGQPDTDVDRIPVGGGVPSQATAAAVDRLVQTYTVGTGTEMDARLLAALRDAFTLVGQRYVWGGESWEEGGWDCSGLVYYTYGRQGINVPRVATGQWLASTHIRQSDAIAGDLVFWLEPSGLRAYHVAMYVGDGMVVEAANPTDGIIYRKLWGGDHVVFGTFRDRAVSGSAPVNATTVTVRQETQVQQPAPRTETTMTASPVAPAPTQAPTTQTPAPVPSATPTPTPTASKTPTPTPSVSTPPVMVPSIPASPTPSKQPTPAPSVPTVTPTPSRTTPAPTPTPTKQPTTPAPAITPTPTPSSPVIIVPSVPAITPTPTPSIMVVYVGAPAPQVNGTTLTIPKVAGVVYTRDKEVIEPGTYRLVAGMKFTIKAVALGGYQLVGDTEWDITIPSATPTPKAG